MRGVLLAGGTGSRLHPLTASTNKHLLPIAGRPMVEWSIEALVRADVTEIIVVTGPEHVAAFRELLGDGAHLAVDRLEFAVQARPGGIAEALGLTEAFADGGPIVLMLADNLLEHSLRDMVTTFSKEPTGARLLLSEMDDDDHLRHLGVPALDEEGRIVSIVEKPQSPPSRFAVTGVYCYEFSVYDVVKTLEPSGRGELEITDVNNHYVASGDVAYDVLEGFWGDAGESLDAYRDVDAFVASRGANNLPD
ncbi:MAG TPA: sugar phosphate nucleotidyltransferase [Acidimicrobiales bacterium]|jgi:glucose-1-phosphate thymidylyltransferase|nr:sugar phosphate nucleotidyltransferase [Acidimicrobiales bacterium]